MSRAGSSSRSVPSCRRCCTRACSPRRLGSVSFSYYARLEPLWAFLAGSGVALILLALVLNRRLRRSPGGEKGGYTAAPLYSGVSPEGLPAAAAVVGFAPDVSPAPEPRTGDYSAGGGKFGGGGASGSFD